MRAESGRCPSCGGRLPRAAGWCPACGAAQGGALEIVDLTDDGRAPRPTTAVVERRRGRPSFAVLVALGAVGVLVAAGAALGGSDGTDTPTGDDIRRGSSTTTAGARSASTSAAVGTDPAATTVPAVGTLLLGETSGVELVALTVDGAVVAVDLDSGGVQTLSDASSSFRSSQDAPIAVAALGHDVLLLDSRDGRVNRIMTGVPSRTLQRANERGVVLSSDHRSLWAMDGSAGASRIDLALGGLVPGTQVDVPWGAWPVGARSDGLLMQASTGGIYLLTPGAAPRQMANGVYLASTEDVLATFTCDAALRCRIEAGDGGAAIPVQSGYQEQGRLSPDGRWLAVPSQSGTREPRVLLVDLRAGETTELDVAVGTWSPYGSPMAWSPDGRWLLIPSQQRGGRFLVVDVTTRQAHPLDLGPLELQPLADLRMATAATPS